MKTLEQLYLDVWPFVPKEADRKKIEEFTEAVFAQIKPKTPEHWDKWTIERQLGANFIMDAYDQNKAALLGKK